MCGDRKFVGRHACRAGITHRAFKMQFTDPVPSARQTRALILITSPRWCGSPSLGVCVCSATRAIVAGERRVFQAHNAVLITCIRLSTMPLPDASFFMMHLLSCDRIVTRKSRRISRARSFS